MAGAGYKLFATGDVLTAAQVNTYLNEQTVMVFADSAARTTALSGVLAEGMVSYLQDTNAVEVYNGSGWVGVSGAGDVTEVQAGVGISVASGTGPIPVITNSSTDLITTAGDLLYGTAADTVARLGIGTVGQVLQVNSGATAPEWAAPAGGGGKVLQVVSGTTTTQTVSVSQTMADTTLTASITPTLATSKVLILVTQHMLAERFAEAAGAGLRIMRDATAILTWEGSALSGSNYLYQRIRVNSVDADRNTFMGVTGMSYLDSPATTSATTYKTQFRIGATGSSASAIAQYDSGPSTITLLEIGV
jgi:hypothetical protein